MKTINYDKYYWQNDKVRLRAMLPEDWEEHYYNCFDSEARRMLQYELELPPTIEKNQSDIELFSNFKPETKRLMFTIETLDGVNVGAFNLNSIDQKNEGVVRQAIYTDGKYVDEILYGLTKDEFNERNL